MSDYNVTLTQRELQELHEHIDDLVSDVRRLKSLADAALAYRRVLYAMDYRNELTDKGTADLERVDEEHGDALDNYYESMMDAIEEEDEQ